jgi:protein involved in polysaccharide export with SLBB domain
VAFREQTPQFIYFLPGGKVTYTPDLDLRKCFSGIGLSDAPERMEAIVYRNGVELKRLNVKALIDAEPSAWNGPLVPGDIVVVNSTLTLRVWFMEHFGRIGEVRLAPGITLSKALAFIGGVSVSDAGSNKAEIRIRRGDKVFKFPRRLGPEADTFEIESGDTFSLWLPKQVHVSVMGMVGGQGVYTVEEETPILDVIAQAKGVLDKGTLKGVFIFRKGEVLRADLSTAPQGSNPPRFVVEDEDLVYVPENEERVYVLGEVRVPGRYPYPPIERMRAADVLSMAGGLGGSGTLRRVSLLRADKSGVLKPRSFNLDEYFKDGKIDSNPEILPGDVLFFGQPKGVNLETITKVASSALLLQTLTKQGN